MPVTKISENEAFAPFINSNAGKLIVIDFYADWCGPCKAIAPYVEELSNTYTNVAFAKVDIQECDTIAESYRVSGIPYFVLMKNGKMIGSITGAKKEELKNKIEANMGTADGGENNENGENSLLYGIAKAIDLSSVIDKSASECLNEDDEHPWTNAVIESSNGASLKSDCDEQLLLRIVFQQKVKLYGIKLIGPNGSSPNKLRLFINQTNTLDFDKAENGTPTLDINVNPEDLNKDSDAINLPKLKFANVTDITVFVPGNADGDDVTQLKSLVFVGNVHGSRTDMNEFKRVAGKVGEGE